jgi:hypothetical protein
VARGSTGVAGESSRRSAFASRDQDGIRALPRCDQDRVCILARVVHHPVGILL